MGPKELVRVLTKTTAAGLPVLIKGAPGIGKSDIVAQVAAILDYDLIISHPVVSDPTDFKGLPGIVDGQAEFLPYGDLRNLLTATKPTIAFLDDLGQAPAVVQAAAMQLILARRVNGHKVSDKVVFIAATNRRQDKAGVTSILEPVKSRFASILELEVNVDEWVEWALANNIPTELIGFVYYRPNILNSFAATADITNSPCPRTMAYVGKLLNAGLDSMEVIAGAIGEGAAAELVGFIKIYRDLPDIDDIISKPSSTFVPTQPATLYAIVGALLSKLSNKTVDSIIAYGNRMPADFNMLLMRNGVKAYPALQNNASYINWVVKNQSYLL